jgi:hypothetical protein
MSKNHLHTFDLIGDAGLRAIERAVHDRALKGLDTADEILELTNFVSACRAELQHRAADDAILRELSL